MSELLTDLLEQARKRGATAADAFVVEDQSFSAQVRLGQVDTVKHAARAASGPARLRRPLVAAASTSDLSASRSRGSWTRPCRSRASPPPTTSAGLPEVSEALPRGAGAGPARPGGAHALTRGEDRPGAAGRGGGARERSAHHQLGGRGLRRSPRSLRLRDQPRLRRPLRDLVVQPLSFSGGLRER